MRTIINENTWLSRSCMDFGWGNGYVILDQDHPDFGKHYDDIEVSIHGGLTFGQFITEETISDIWPDITKDDIGKYMIGLILVIIMILLKDGLKKLFNKKLIIFYYRCKIN